MIFIPLLIVLGQQAHLGPVHHLDHPGPLDNLGNLGPNLVVLDQGWSGLQPQGNPDVLGLRGQGPGPGLGPGLGSTCFDFDPATGGRADVP